MEPTDITDGRENVTQSTELDKTTDWRGGQEVDKANTDKDVTRNTAIAIDETEENDKSFLECPVCLQSCQFPVQLPCGHIFCFLCVKGVVNRSKGCALCRQLIPSDFLCKPNLLFKELLEQTVMFDDGYSWFYEGTDGWWQYDDRTSKELEMHHKAGHPSCELLIAGFVYIIDLTNMVQFRRSDRTRKRRIKRDLVTLRGRKGIAGLKIISDNMVAMANDRPGADGHETNAASGQQSIPIQHINQSYGDSSFLPPTPHNTPQTPMTPSESPPTNGPTEYDLSGPLRRLRLTDDINPSPANPQEGPEDSSFDSTDYVSASMEDLRASHQQLQSENDDHDTTDVGNNLADDAQSENDDHDTTDVGNNLADDECK